MKNHILPALIIVLFALSLTNATEAQTSVASSSSFVEVSDDGEVKKLVITESETDKSYRMNCRFSKKHTAKIRSYLTGLLGSADREVSDVRQVWKHMPDGAPIEGLEITLRDGQFSIKAKDDCCPGDLDELKAIADDIKSMLE